MSRPKIKGLHCHKHPTYKAMRPPMNCKVCLEIWLATCSSQPTASEQPPPSSPASPD